MTYDQNGSKRGVTKMAKKGKGKGGKGGYQTTKGASLKGPMMAGKSKGKGK